MNWKFNFKIQKGHRFLALSGISLLILHHLHDCSLGILPICSEQQCNSVV